MTSFLRVSSGLARIAVDDHGGPGPAVLCLHAGVADRRAWEPLAATLDGTARVVAPDLRHFGLTTGPAEDYSDVQDAIAVLDALGIERAVVIGNSWGGRVAVSVALDHPERVAGLVLIGTAISPWPDPDLSTTPEEALALDQAFDDAEAAGNIEEAIRLGAHLWLDGCLADEGRVAGSLRDLYAAMNRVSLAAADPGTSQPHGDQWSRLGSITVPTAVVYGSLDLPYLRLVNEQVAEAIPYATWHWVEEAGHLVAMERPDAVADVVREILARSA